MDDCRFDNWTRMVSGQTDRRTAVKGLAGGVAALATLIRAELGLAQSDVELENNCKGTDGKCQNDRDCCSKNCKKRNRRRSNGRCVCSGTGQGCKRDQGCCSGRCNGSQCICGDKGDDCDRDRDCCSNICSNRKCKCIKQGNRCDPRSQGRPCCSGRCPSNGFCS